MKEDNQDSMQTISNDTFKKIFKISGYIIGSILLLIITTIIGISLWLTPERITRIINNEAGKYVDADVHLEKLDYTLWSSFPYLGIQIDTLKIKSRSLQTQNLPDRLRTTGNLDSLVNLRNVTGKVNLLSLIKKNVVVKDIVLDGLDLNLVAVNDSINNFNIIPQNLLEKFNKFKINSFSINSVALTNSNLKFRYLSQSAELSTHLSKFKVTDKDNLYKLFCNGMLSLDLKNTEILHDFPYKVGGNIGFDSDMSKIDIKNLRVALGNIITDIVSDISVEGEPVINTLSVGIAPFRLNRFIDYLPLSIRKYLDGITLNIVPEMELKLNAPFNIASDKMPSVSSEFDIDRGSIILDIPVSDNLVINDIYLKGHLKIASDSTENSQLSIEKLSFCSEGFKVSANALADELTSDTVNLSINFHIDGNLDEISKIPLLRPYNLKMDINSDMTASCLISGLTEKPVVSDVILKGSADSHDIAMTPGKGITASGSNLSVELDGKIKGLLPEQLKDADILLKIALGNAKANLPGQNINLTKINTMLTARNGQGNAKAEVGSLSYNNGSNSMSVNSVVTDISIRQCAAKQRTNKYKPSKLTGEEEVIIKDFPHTPRFLTFSVPDNVKNLLYSTQASYSLKVGKGRFTTPVFPSDNIFSNIVLKGNLDTLSVKSMRLHTAGCGINLAGNITDLRGFIAGIQPEKLKIRMKMGIETLDINRVARVYENGVAATQGVAATLPSPKPTKADASDSVALLIPLNIDAKISASANHLIYTDLDITNITTDLEAVDGNAYIKDLSLHTPFASALVNFKYSTSDLSDLNMELNAKASDMNIVSFFDCYRNTLLKKMPYMSNLTGILSFDANAKIKLFPTMYLDVPSLTGDLNFRGRELSLHQSKFIRKITRFLFLHNKENIYFENLDVNATIHDNLVELVPFDFDFDRYKFTISGNNNLDGMMFYHIGIKKSLIPFPFGVNIKGTFDKPILRFGGAGLKPSDTEKVGAVIMEDKEINLLLNLKYGFMEFLKKASEDYEISQSLK